MTMRQVAGLMKVVRKSDDVDFYHQLLSYGTIHGVKLPSLNEFLSLTSSSKTEEPKGFDDKTDKFLEEQALKNLEESKKANG